MSQVGPERQLGVDPRIPLARSKAYDIRRQLEEEREAPLSVQDLISDIEFRERILSLFPEGRQDGFDMREIFPGPYGTNDGFAFGREIYPSAEAAARVNLPPLPGDKRN